jgi:hypothetical protein
MEEPVADQEKFEDTENRIFRPQDKQASATDFPKVRKSTGIPKGVYRFKTHEEADEWTTRILPDRSQK